MPARKHKRSSEARVQAVMSIAERVRHLVSDHADVDFAEATLDATLGDDLGLDSLGYVEIVVAIEREFRLKFDHADGSYDDGPDVAWYGGAANAAKDGPGGQGTVGHLIALVEGRVAQQRG